MPHKPSNAPAFIALPVLLAEPPTSSGWIHEIKHDGFRTLLRFDRRQAQAFSRGGHDLTDKYSRVIEACRKLRYRSALIDGEIIVQDKKGVSDFAALRAALEWEPYRLAFARF
jgi:bifunctional non-homologous end joining protein LigD